ncbi:MAG: nitroreductase family protein [Bacillota bacterium]
MTNPVLENLLNRASVRRFKDQDVEASVIEAIVRAGQQAPFTGQMYSVVVTKDQSKREEMAKLFGRLPAAGPVFMLICVDFRRLEKFIASKGRTNSYHDDWMMILGIQDASYFAQNIVTAAESLGLGSVFLGAAPWHTERLAEIFALPPRVWPMVGLVLGYPDGRPAARPRIPLNNVLHWDQYRDLDEQEVAHSLSIMDAGLIREGYYRNLNGKIPLRNATDDKVTYDEYGWAEHISRKYGQGGVRAADMKEILAKQGVNLR